ncbi:MAG TPA: WHG domain-containing protein [Solirubrobacteraceae bacterium]|jgi:AcrR family transcriptional regulator
MPRVGLDPDAVVDAAARIADTDGLEAVTLARLAADLGVRPPSLYVHVSGLADLHARLGARGARELADELQLSAAGRAGREALDAIGYAYRDYATEHPGSYEALQRLPGSSDADLSAATAVVDVVLAVLRGYGIEGGEAIHATRIIRSAFHGFVTLERVGGFAIPLELDETFARLLATLDQGLRTA